MPRRSHRVLVNLVVLWVGVALVIIGAVLGEWVMAGLALLIVATRIAGFAVMARGGDPWWMATHLERPDRPE